MVLTTREGGYTASIVITFSVKYLLTVQVSLPGYVLVQPYFGTEGEKGRGSDESGTRIEGRAAHFGSSPVSCYTKETVSRLTGPVT